MSTSIRSVIIATGSFIPENIIPNSDFLENRFYEKNGLRIFGSHPFPFGDEIQNDWLMRVEV
jgi:hypothetical protein